MNDQLVHIFDNSTCLTKRQLKDYVTGVMGEEECHAAEVHLNSCPFCSEAVDGLMMHKEEAAELLAGLNPDFLKEHFARQLPQVHLNSIAVPVEPPATGKKKKANVRPLWRTASVAAAVLFCTGVVWYYSYQKDALRHTQVAIDVPAASQPAADNKMIAQSTPPGNGNRQDAGPAAPVVPPPASAQQYEADTADSYAFKAKAPEKTAAEAAPPSTTVLMTDSVQSSKYTISNQSATLNAASAAAGYSNAQNYNAYSATSPNDSRPFYGNAYRNNSRSQDFSANLKRQNTDNNSQPSLVTSSRLAKPLALPKAATKDTEADNVPAVAASRPDQSKSNDHLNTGGARTEGTLYVVDGVQTKGKRDAKESAAVLKKEKPVLPVANADDLYDKGDYKSALAAYNRDINHNNKGHRHYAIMGAARCYLNMGQKAKAKQLLQGIVDEGGAQSHAAKKMLRKMESDAQ